MSITNFFSSLRHAFSGVVFTYTNEQNFRIQSWVAVIVVLLGFIVGITAKEWVVVVLVITLVLLLEMMNTVVETVIDILAPKMHHYVKTIKDIMAAAVLLASLTAIVIGVLIFYPYFQVFLL